MRGGTGKSLIPFLIQGQFLCTPCPWIAIFILNLVPRRGGHSSVLLHWYSDSEIRSEFRRRKVSASGAVTQTRGLTVKLVHIMNEALLAFVYLQAALTHTLSHL